jgi:hypothetical protein
MEKKKLPQEFEISELFLVKAGNDYKRTFYGQIYRETTKEGKFIVRGNVVVNDGKIWSSAETQDELGLYLDYLCVMKLDYKLNSYKAVTTKIFNTDFFLN